MQQRCGLTRQHAHGVANTRGASHAVCPLHHVCRIFHENWLEAEQTIRVDTMLKQLEHASQLSRAPELEDQEGGDALHRLIGMLSILVTGGEQLRQG